ncbi:phage protein Gp36 family protein [Pseudotamlana carrageenivorans]|uniref:DUF1320 domain-containing protein n=1 Tax=Pseudotamlana carrageenivorans TaxID=2069432 RepID=A0A2I7SKS0_9FLAO|nr:phage protein Gp36 family protein [Tamlana carrageenivorans]AUS06470.1 DUF1320 domain-containing protein [Tamlana carrageenivorans]
MAFLIKDELKTVATIELINLITQSDETIVTEIIEESIEIFKSYLFKYFDTEAIFTASGTDRSKVVLKYLKDVVIHELYIRRSKQMNDVAKMRFDEAMLWLEKVSKGNISPDLPEKQVDTDGDGQPDSSVPFMKVGSRKTYKNHF